MTLDEIDKATKMAASRFRRCMRINKQILKQEDRLAQLRMAGPWADDTTESFVNFIMNIGMNIYEKHILPIETQGEPQLSVGKIIPFSGANNV